jgi:hypothetical protein
MSMKRHWMRTLGAIALGLLSSSSWAQQADTNPKVVESALTVGVLAQHPTPIEIAPAPRPVGGVPPGAPLQGTAQDQAYLHGHHQPCHDCEPGRCGQFVFGGGVYLFQPRWETNPAFRIISTPTPVPGLTANNRVQREFDYGFNVAPMAFVGYEWNSGFGIRGRWFSFSGSDTQSHVNAPNDNTDPANPLGLGVNGTAADFATIQAVSDLSLYAVDLEGTKRICNGLWSFLVAGGVRYAEIDQSYNYLSTDPNTRTERVLAQQSFSGIGPTVALECRRTFGCSGFGVYANARGSILFGESNESATQIRIDHQGGLDDLDTGRVSRDDVLPIGELEVGVECCKDFGRCRFFGQAGFVGQVWWGAGNSANVDSALAGGGTDNNSNLGFLGLALRAGINF